MRLIFALVFLLGIGIAGTAVYMAMEQFRQYELANAQLRARTGNAVEMTPVVVTTTELRYGTPLERQHAQVIQYPKAHVPEGAFTALEDLFGGGNDGPRAALRKMERGELFMAQKVTNFGQEAGVAASLEPGMRAFTIQVDVTTGVSGLIQPGDRVDVNWSGRSGAQQMTRLLLEDLEVIAVDQVADVDVNRPIIARTVTVEVTPIVVAMLAQAQSSGRLLLSLRGIAEEEILGPLAVTQESLLGIEEVAEEEERICTVTERRGGTQVQVVVPCPDE